MALHVTTCKVGTDMSEFPDDRGTKNKSGCEVEVLRAEGRHQDRVAESGGVECLDVFRMDYR